MKGSAIHSLILGMSVLFSVPAFAQRVLTEAVLHYKIDVVNAAPTLTEEASNMLKQATLTLWLRGNVARIDLSSPLRLQSIYFNGTDGSATITRSSGDDRYQWNLDAEQWKNHNRKWLNATYSGTGETLEIAGLLCRRTKALLADSSEVDIFYSPQVVTVVKGYDPLFEPIEGLPVQYEMVVEGSRIRYVLDRIETTPVPASKFDIPATGFKVMVPEKTKKDGK